MLCICVCFHFFLSGRGTKSGISNLSWILYGRNRLLLLFILFHLFYFHFILFLSQRHKSHLYLEELVAMKMTSDFVSLPSCSSLYLDLSLCCYAFDFYNTDKDPIFCSFSNFCYHVSYHFRTSHLSKGTRDAIV